MYPTAELELLDYLGACDEPYMYLERCVFAGDRDHALRSMQKMLQDGSIAATLEGRPVENWKWQEWRRLPYDRATSTALDSVRLELTEAKSADKGDDWQRRRRR